MSEPRCYTTAQVLARLQMNRRTFFELKRRGRLPFLEELRPRLGRIVRYRADRIDAYLAGKFQPVLVKRGA
jgi:predicted DNA-binding transcriptional regulator AlpA